MGEYKIDFSTPEYKGTLKEETEKIEEMVDNEEVAGIIAKLRDESFGNEEQRKKMVDLLTSLMMCKDASARKLFKDVGNALTNIGSSLLGNGESEVEEVMVEPEMVDEPVEMDYEEDPYRGPLVIQRYESKIKGKESLTEATEISVNEIPDNKKDSFIYFSKVISKKMNVDTNPKNATIFDGIHGMIAIFPSKGMGSERLYRDVLTLLLKNRDFRWVESDNRDLQIGF